MDNDDQWQIEQGARCGCRGTDEYCGCQNVQPGDRTKFNGGPLLPCQREVAIPKEEKPSDG